VLTGGLAFAAFSAAIDTFIRREPSECVVFFRYEHLSLVNFVFVSVTIEESFHRCDTLTYLTFTPPSTQLYIAFVK